MHDQNRKNYRVQLKIESVIEEHAAAFSENEAISLVSSNVKELIANPKIIEVVSISVKEIG